MNQTIKQRIELIQRGEVPDGYKKTKIGIVPNTWVYSSLSQYLIQHNEISEYSDQYPVLTSSRKGIFLQSDYYNRDIASDDNTGYNVVPRGYFTYRHMSDDEIFRFNINNLVDKGIVSTLYPVFTTRNINDYYLQSLLNEAREFMRFAILQKQGGSRTYMYFAKLRELKVCLPPLSEQNYITKILATCDMVTELKAKLLIEKQKQKKWLMQKLLTGKKRLPGFIGERRVTRLNKIVTRITSKNAKSNSNVLTISAQYGLINQEDFFNKPIASDSKEGYYLLERDDFAYNKSYSNGYPFGAIKRLKLYTEGIVSPLYICFRKSSANFSVDFLEQYFEAGLLNVEIQAFAQEGARNHGLLNIAVEDFFNSQVFMPSLDEQNAIALVMTTADTEIFLLMKELDQLMQMKKALLQLLMTGIVRVDSNCYMKGGETHGKKSAYW